MNPRDRSVNFSASISSSRGTWICRPKARNPKSVNLDNAPTGHGILTRGGFEVPRFQEGPSRDLEPLVFRHGFFFGLVAIRIAFFGGIATALIEVEGGSAGAIVCLVGFAARLGSPAVAVAVAVAVRIGLVLGIALLLVLLLLLQLGGQDAVIVFGVLEIILRHHAVARCVGVPRKLQVLLIHMRGGPANLHFGPGRIECAVRVVTATTTAATATALIVVAVLRSAAATSGTLHGFPFTSSVPWL